MNRADIARGIAFCEAMAKRLRAALATDAENEYAEQGTVPTWRLPGITVVGSTTHPTVEVTDEDAFVKWVAERYPTEVETVVRVRPAWKQRFLQDVAERGDPPCDEYGEVIPGLQWRPGGGFGGIRLVVNQQVKAELGRFADEVVSGQRPLQLPGEAAE